MKKKWIIITIALLVRILWAVLVKVEPVSDSEMYHIFASNIANGEGYSYPDGRLTAYWPVGTSAIYGVLYFLFGISSLPIVVFNLIIGTLIVLLVYRIAYRDFNQDIANIASLIMAFWPLLIQYTTILASELPFIFLLLLSIEIWGNERIHRIGRVIIWSILLCLATYIRTTALPLIVIYPAISFLKGKDLRSAIITGLLAFSIMIIVFSPWVYRNYQVFDDFVLVATNSGTNLWMGNNENANGGYMAPLDVGTMNEVERNNLLKQEAKEYMLKHPFDYIKLSVKRFVITYKAETIGIVWNQKYLDERLSASSIFLLKLLSSLFWLSVFSASGIGIILYILRSKKLYCDHIFLTTMYLFIIPILTVGQDRYHIPMNPFLAIFASYFFYVVFRNDSNV